MRSGTMRKSGANFHRRPAEIHDVEESLHANVAAPRFRTLLLGIFRSSRGFACMAGVYGVMAYVVGQRANEIGLRVALGASPAMCYRMVLRQSLTLTLRHRAGLAGAAGVTQLLSACCLA